VTLTDNELGRISVDGPDLGLGAGAVLWEIPSTRDNAGSVDLARRDQLPLRAVRIERLPVEEVGLEADPS
jgi:hypothetical protein